MEDSRAEWITRDILRPLTTERVQSYLRKTGWTLVANHFVRGEGWTLQEAIDDPHVLIYAKPDPRCPEPFLVQVPGQPEHDRFLSDMQQAVERLAAVEDTTFLVMVCRLLGVEQIVLRPEKKEEKKA